MAAKVAFAMDHAAKGAGAEGEPSASTTFSIVRYHDLNKAASDAWEALAKVGPREASG